MPEGPEIRRAADEVEKAIIGLPVREIWFAFPSLQHYEEVLTGARIERVDTKGKAMLIRFDNGYTIYSHNQLYGKWYVRSSYNYPSTNRQLRLAIHNEKNQRCFIALLILKYCVMKKFQLILLYQGLVLIS